MALAVKNFTRRPPPHVPFAKAALAVLPGWEISLVFVGETRARSLNRTLRGRDYVPNVLSYQVGSKSGEIIICLAVLEREAPRHGLEPRAYCLLLFIHGLLHLKGRHHSATMERRERALVARFVAVSRSPRTPSLPSHEKTHCNRHRHRHVSGQASRRRRGR